jgi:hypothetical protein
MSKYRKQFLAVLKPIWARRLPDWKPGLFSPSFYSSADATFSWTGHTDDSALRFHLFVEFSSKQAGEFTGDIFITDQTNQLPTTDFHRLPDEISSGKIGIYRIGMFFMGTDSWWHLRDEVAESKLFWESRGLRAVGRLKRKKKDWYVASYDVPQKQIMQEAAEDFTEKFVTTVVPKLLSL